MLSTVEQRLHDALVAFLASRLRQLADGPLDDVIIPLRGGGVLRVPVLLLDNE